MTFIARRTASSLFKIAFIGSILVIAVTGCGGGGGQSASVSRDPTTIDASYGNQGHVTFPLGVRNGGAGPSVLQADGKLIITGWRQTGSLPIANNAQNFNPTQIYVLRLNSDGSLDPTFGVGGEMRFNVKGSDTVADVKLQADGKILLAVHSVEPCARNALDFTSPCTTPDGRQVLFISALVRLTPQGVLDSTLGGTGVVETAKTRSKLTLALQTDGKILFLHSTSIARFRILGWALTRYNTDGTPDPTFNQGSPLSSKCKSDGNALVVQFDGRIVVGGTDGALSTNPTVNPGFCLERINVDGSHDSSFRAADLWTKFDANVQLHSLSTLPNGSLLAVGQICDTMVCGVVAARYDVDGVLDPSFGVAGIVKQLALDRTFAVTNYALTPEGDLVIFGSQRLFVGTGQPQQYQPVWVRLDASGQPVSGFGVNGILFGTPDIKEPRDFLRDHEGRWLVIYTSTLSDGNLGLVVTRFMGERLIK